MKNLELARIFYQIAEFIEMDEVSFRSRAYNKAARVLDSLEKDVQDIYQKGGTKALKKIPGIGEAIAKKIEEFIKTGKVKTYQRLKKQCPVDLETLTMVEGLGARKIKILYKKLGIRNLKDLEKEAKMGKISELEGFGEKSEKNILQAIQFVKAGQNRFLISSILPIVRQIINQLKELPQVYKISIAGSARRMKETVGDIDILVTSNKPDKVIDSFVKMFTSPKQSEGGPRITKVWAKGPTKSSVRFRAGLASPKQGEGGFDCDLRVVKKESFGAALQYFTGSKDHNILIRKIAKKKGLKLNEYGVFKGKKKIAGKNEKEVYQAIGLPYIEPELRTNTGEIEAALRQAQGKLNQLPKLINYNDIKGEIHCHSNWSDGSRTINELALSAKKIGYQYLVITDHTKGLTIANGLDEARILRQMKEIDKVNKSLKGIKILKGCEANIKVDGTIDIKDEVLDKLDIVLAGVHFRLKMDKKDMTERIIKAIENPHIDIIVHPFGRLIDKRPGYQMDFKQVLKAAKKNKTVLEINAHTSRLDLRDINIRQAVEAGVKLAIGSDIHSVNCFQMMELGIAQARRGWAEKKDILNTRTLTNFLEFFKDKE